MKTATLLLLGLLMIGCDAEKNAVDGDGLLSGETDVLVFSRGCQCYFRGSLSRARDEFNGVVYRFPDSPLAEDARLAVRRIDADLADGATVIQPDNTFLVATSAVLVGRQAVVPVMNRISSALRARGLEVEIIPDEGAPEITLVLYPDGGLQQAGEIADSLSVWLTRPETVPVQPGSELTNSIVPGYEGVVIIVGAEASVSNSAPGP